MNDDEIINLFLKRDENGIIELSTKYHPYCYKIAWNLLANREDAEECLNDTWMRAWNAIPPKKPNRLELFLGTITRNLSFDRWKAKNAQKRGNGIMDTTLDELAECIPAAHNTEEAVEAAELERSINAFLHTLSEQECNVFLRRYWFVEEYAEIAGRYGMNLNTVKTSLFRTRKKLQKYLEQQKILQEYMVRRVGYEQHWKKLMQGNLNLQEVEHARADVNAMKTIVRRQMVEVHKAEKELEDARNRLKTVMQERKVQEKLREKAFEEFKQELAEAETKEIDELVSYTYNKGEQGE